MSIKFEINQYVVLLSDKSLTVATFTLKKFPTICDLIQGCNDCNGKLIPINCTSKVFCKLIDYVEHGIPVEHKYLPICRYLGIIPVQTLMMPVPNESLSIDNCMDLIIDIINLKIDSKKSSKRIILLLIDVMENMIEFPDYTDDIFELLFGKANKLSHLFINMMELITIDNDEQPNPKFFKFRCQDLIRDNEEKKHWISISFDIQKWCERVDFNFSNACTILSQEGKMCMSYNYLQQSNNVIIFDIFDDISISAEKFIRNARSKHHYQIIKELPC